MLPSGSRSMIITNGLFMILSLFSVILRLYVRINSSAPLSRDDYLIVAAWVFSAGLAVTHIIGVPLGGFGEPFDSLDKEKEHMFLKILWIEQFWYLLAVALVKLSILSFYGRVFSSGQFPSKIKFLIALVVCWLIVFLFATFFQVWPIRCEWEKCFPATYLTNYTALYVACSVTDIVLDIVTLCMPISFIRNLHTNRSQKAGLTAIFGVGIFCIISSIARLFYAVRYYQIEVVGNLEVNYDVVVVNMIMWSGIEACASTICANLPCYYTLFGKSGTLRPFLTSVRSFFSLRSGSYKHSKGRSMGTSASSENIVTKPAARSTKLYIGKADTLDDLDRDLEMCEISVTTTTKMDSGKEIEDDRVLHPSIGRIDN